MEPYKIFLGGVNSTGKTTLINVLATANRNINVCYGSKEFFKWLRLKEGDYNSLENLSDEYKDLELSKMIPFLVKEVEYMTGTIWIFAGHFGRINNSTIMPAVGNWISNFDLIVLLTADPQTIIKRIKEDFNSGARKRDKLLGMIESSSNPLKIFTELLKQTEQISKKISSKYGVPLLKLNSSKHNPIQLSKQILNHIRLSD